MTAARVDPEIVPALGPYLSMTAGPSSLEAVEPRARAVFASAWRPGFDPGPTRRELVELVAATVSGP